MASTRIVEHICDRCPASAQTKATTSIKFSVEGVDYEADLCNKHAEAFQLSMLAWTRLAREIPKKRVSTTFSAVRPMTPPRGLYQESAAKAPDIVHKPLQPALDPVLAVPMELFSHEVQAWDLSPHAVQRAQERGYTLDDVVLTAAKPEQSWPSSGEDDRWIHQRGECRVAVDRNNKTIITVLHKDQDKYGPNGKYATERSGTA